MERPGCGREEYVECMNLGAVYLLLCSLADSLIPQDHQTTIIRRLSHQIQEPELVNFVSLSRPLAPGRS